jgi:hypothetical protein
MGRFLTVLAICGIAGVMAGCSASFSVGDGNTVNKSDEVSLAQTFLSHELSDLPPAQSVDCPSDVEAKVDSTYECQATLTNGQDVSMPFHVTSVNGDRAGLHVNPALVTEALAVEVIYRQFDPTVPQSVECPTGVPAAAHKTFDCHVTLKNGTTATVTVQVEAASSSGQHLRVVGAHKD